MSHVMVFGTKSATEEEVERALIKEQEYYEALQAAFDVIELLLPVANRDDEAVMKALRHLQVKTWTLPMFKAEEV